MTSYTSKLADETFCSDRSIANGTGYKTDSYTFYGAHNRLQDNKKPSLKCSQNNDKFKMSNESAKLDYPVGLILVDEAAFAGGRAYYNEAYSPNSNYYYTMVRTFGRSLRLTSVPTTRLLTFGLCCHQAV